MKQQPKEYGSTGRVNGLVVALILVGVLVLSAVVFLLLMGGQAVAFEVPFHLGTGFVWFLFESIPRISFNAATWLPGVVAFLLGVAGVHRFLGAWARRRDRRWTIGTSLALALIVPVLFVIAFLVPGVLLQVKQLSQVSWTERDRGGRAVRLIGDVQTRWMEVLEFASIHDGKFPDTLEEMAAQQAKDRHHNRPRDASADPFIYLGADLTDVSDPDLPLVISPPFFGKEEAPQRWLVTIGGETEKIPADQVNEWIRRALKARRAAVAPDPP